MSDLLTATAVLPSMKASTRRQAFQDAANRLGPLTGVPARRILDGLLAREKLGSTAMGYGVAIPHARIEGLGRIVALFARLGRPIDFEAADGEGVDLMFVLLAPEHAGADHLRALARVSRLMRDAGLRAKLRQSSGADALHALLTEPDASRAA